jgi:hypothetical protein
LAALADERHSQFNLLLPLPLLPGKFMVVVVVGHSPGTHSIAMSSSGNTDSLFSGEYSTSIYSQIGRVATFCYSVAPF